jgi:hypothetical protein
MQSTFDQMDTSATRLTMAQHQLSKQVVADVDSDLTRLSATCRVATKPKPRGSWETVYSGVATFHAALDFVRNYSSSAYETAIFLEHERYGGIIVWSSSEPDIANRFGHYSV